MHGMHTEPTGTCIIIIEINMVPTTASFVASPPLCRDILLAYLSPNETQRFVSCCRDFASEWKNDARLQASSLLRNKKDDVNEAVLCAASCGKARVVDILLRQRSSSTKQDALVYAACRGCVATVETLVAHGACVRSLCGDQALVSAARCGHLDVVRVLVQCGADVRFREDAALRWCSYTSAHGSEMVLEYLIQNGANIHAMDDDALVIAAKGGHCATVTTLLRRGADVHAQKDKAMEWAIVHQDFELVKLLMKADVEVYLHVSFSLTEKRKPDSAARLHL